VMLAAGVFCYFGALDAVFSAAHARLSPGGMFIFTVEELCSNKLDVDWQLRSQGRYAHSLAYLERIIADTPFEVLEIGRQELRREGDAPVAGILVALRRIEYDA